MHVHDPQHDDPRSKNQRNLALTLALVCLYMGAEVVGGLISGSLALLADAGHMLADAAALGLTLFAIAMSRRPPTPQRTYGYYRAEILAALVNGIALCMIAVWLFREAAARISDPPEVLGALMMGVACGGLVVNLLGLWILSDGRRDNLNVRGAWLHVLSDALGSIGAIVAGALVWAFDWRWADPAASFVIGALVIFSAWRLLKETVDVLLENAPKHLDVETIHASMAELPGVLEVHDLHVWTITSGMEALSGHVVADDSVPHGDLLLVLRERLKEQFSIDHITIQIEPKGFPKDEGPV